MTAFIVFRQPPKPMASKPSDFEVQLERLLEKEKIARVNSEHLTSVTVLKDIISLCHGAGEWERLNEQIVYLMGRRGQSKKAQIDMVQLAMSWLGTMGEPQRGQLVATIRDVCAKKIFLQVEYARCVMMIVRSKQDEEDISQAANILQQVQVETYGSMDKREKLEFILYQMKIMLKKNDLVRFYIISKKINENNINDPALADLKATYYAYMAIYYNQEQLYPQATRAYRILDQTLSAHPHIPHTLDFGFSAKPQDLLSNYLGFLVLQPFSKDNQAELTALSEQERLEGQPVLSTLVSSFLSEEIVPCEVAYYRPEEFELFRTAFPHSQNHLEQLRRMLIQHNLRVVSRYYGQLTLQRLSELLRVPSQDCEEQLCALNNNRTISCRIDRIEGRIDFRPVENEQFLLHTWNDSVNAILDLVQVATNLIHREREVYRK